MLWATSPLSGLEMCLFKVRGMEGLEVNLVNQAVGLAKLRLAINIGDPKTIKAVYKAACGDADSTRLFLTLLSFSPNPTPSRRHTPALARAREASMESYCLLHA